MAVTLETGSYSLEMTVSGHTVVQIDGFAQTGEPGQPMLPRRVFLIALPPDTETSTVHVQVTDWEQETLDSGYLLAPAIADTTTTGAFSRPSPVAAPSPTNQEAAGSVSLVSAGQLRQWKYVRLGFSPVLYRPDTGHVDVVTKVTVALSYDLAGERPWQPEMDDTVADDAAADLFSNIDQARGWYSDADVPANSSDTFDYVVITTDAIVANSANLGIFKFRKESMGHRVRFATESDYGNLTGQSPNGTPEKIRQWLIDNYAALGIKYVLLIGNPDPASGDVPMKMCWPLLHYGYYQEAPTDYFYADLSGNWDKNRDGYYGVWVDDTGTGGVDFAAEVSVGRIPVYFGDYATLDNVLQKIMDYEAEMGPAAWRQNALLPMSFSLPYYDGAPLAEQMKMDYLTATGFNVWTLYQQGSAACALNSAFPSSEELRGGAVGARWAANDYGLVVWWGHGSSSTAAVGCDRCWDGGILATANTRALDDDHPGFVFQNSCMNGFPENPNNLQTALLRQGAIATVGATRVSWFNAGVGLGSFDGSTTNSGIAYEYARRIVSGHAAGDALYGAKGSMTPENGTRLMNLLGFNLYGDPSVGIMSFVESGPPLPANNLKLAPAAGDGVQLSWQDNSPNETGFIVESSPDGVSWDIVTTVSADTTTIFDPTHTENRPAYRVAAFNDHGVSEYAEPVSMVSLALPIVFRQ